MAVEVVLPMLGVTVENGKIVEWLKKEGDSVEKGEIIFIVEVEKATTEVESPASGILARIVVPEGVEVPVLSLVAILTEQGEEIPAEYAGEISGASSVEAPVSAPSRSSSQADSSASEVQTAGGPGDGPVKAIPAARKMALENEIDLNSITGTGPEGEILIKDVQEILDADENTGFKATPLARRVAELEGVSLGSVEGTGMGGRIVRADVDRALSSGIRRGAEDIQHHRELKIVPMSSMRKVIAKRMSESFFGAPHIYFFSDVCMDPLLDFRKQILPDFEEKYQLRPSINDFLIKAVALNLADFPTVNSKIVGDEIHILPDINVCLAVALPEGLIVPALANTDLVGLDDIVRQRKELVQKAYDGKLKLEELERGTFTISSLAQYDVTHFTAILNPPQTGILSVGKTREELARENGEIISRKIMTIGLGVDHRVIDGSVAADFIQNLKQKLEQPLLTFMTYR